MVTDTPRINLSPECPRPTCFGVYELLRNSASTFSSLCALYEPAENIRYTFEELFQESEKLRVDLIKRGLREGVGVILKAENGAHFVSMLFALVGIGAVVIPLAPNQEVFDVVRALGDRSVTALITDHSDLGEELPVQHRCSRRWSLHWLNENRQLQLLPELPNAAFIRPTSGTTGKPKLVVLSHATVLERTETVQQSLKLSPADAILWHLPMAHHFISSIILSIRFGSSLLIMPEQLSTKELKAVQHTTIIYGSPQTLRTLSAHADQIVLPDLKLPICTGEAIAPAHAAEFEHKFNVKVARIYGIIEVGLPLGQIAAHQRTAQSTLYPLSRYSVEIHDAMGNHSPPGSIGELVIRGPGMFDAYIEPITTRAEILDDGWFRTGDAARCQTDGSIEVLGRLHSAIRLGHEWIFPEEIEHALSAHPAVENARVLSQTDAHKPTRLVAEIEVKAGVQAPQGSELEVHCYKSLPGEMVPSEFHFVECIRRTPTGKIARGNIE